VKGKLFVKTIEMSNKPWFFNQDFLIMVFDSFMNIYYFIIIFYIYFLLLYYILLFIFFHFYIFHFYIFITCYVSL